MSDEPYKITIRKPGKKTGNTYEICPPCAEKLQHTLVSTEPPKTRRRVEREPELVDTLDQGDEHLQEEELVEAPPTPEVVEKSQVKGEDLDSNVPTDASGECMHANYRQIYGTYKNTPGFYKVCKSCDAVLTNISSKKKRKLTNVGAKNGIRESTPDIENRRR
jgi:hypothetical protein